MGEMMDFEKLWRHNQGALFLKEENQSIEWKKSIAQYFFQYGQKFSEDSLQSQLAKTQEKLSEFESNYLDPKSYLNKLEEELSAAREVIGYYADENTWIEKEIVNGNLFAWGKKHPSHDVSIIPYSIGESNGNFHCFGKRAREFMKQFGGKGE